jgi:hypothetical protein
MEDKNKLLCEKISNEKSEEKLTNYCEKIYNQAYQCFLRQLLNDKNNSINMNISPIKLERSINIIK